jgi:hypothetical protein
VHVVHVVRVVHVVHVVHVVLVVLVIFYDVRPGCCVGGESSLTLSSIRPWLQHRGVVMTFCTGHDESLQSRVPAA